MGTWFGQGAGRNALKASSCGWVAAFLGVEKGRAVYAEPGNGQGRAIHCPKCVKFILFASFFLLCFQPNASPPEPWAGAALEGELSALKEIQCSVWKHIPTVYWYNSMSKNKLRDLVQLLASWSHHRWETLHLQHSFCCFANSWGSHHYAWWEQPLHPLSAWHGRCKAVVSSQVSPTQVGEK